MANQSFYGSINLTDLIEKAKQGHPAFSKSEKNGKVYVNINVWLNEKEDEYKNIMGIQLQKGKDAPKEEKAFYIGNCKKSEYKGPAALNNDDISGLDVPDVQVRSSNSQQASANTTGDDLPF